MGVFSTLELKWIDSHRDILDKGCVEDIINAIFDDRELTNNYSDETARLLILTNYLHNIPEGFAIVIYQTTNSVDIAITKAGHIITECDCGFSRIPQNIIQSEIKTRAFVEKGLNRLGIPKEISYNIVKDAVMVVK